MVYHKRARMYGRRKYKRRGVPKRYAGVLRRAGFAKRYRGSYGVKVGEYKFLATNHAVRSMAQAAEVFPTTTLVIPQGVGGTERIGRKIIVRAIEVRISITQLGSADADECDNTYRMGIFVDSQCNGAAASWLDLFENTHVDSPRDLQRSTRFKILKDWRFCMKASGVGSTTNSSDVITNVTGSTCKVLKFYKKCFIPVSYSTAAGTLAGITMNNLAMYSKRAVASPAAFWDLHFRIRYSDV